MEECHGHKEIRGIVIVCLETGYRLALHQKGHHDAGKSITD